MRLSILLVILAPLSLAGCASGAGGPSYYVKYRADALTSNDVLPYPPETVWRALPQAYADLRFPAGPASRGLMEFTTPQLKVQGQLYGLRNSEFIECGVVDQGQPLEDHGEVTLAMITRLEPAQGNATAVRTQVDAYARRRDVASDPVSCASRGVLEQAIVSALVRRLGGTPPPAAP